MVRSYGFWGTIFKNVIVPVSLGVVAFFVYRKIDGRIVVLERDVKGLDLLGKYKNLEMRLESNILYNSNITSQLNKNITETSKDVVSLSEKLSQLKSSIVTLDCLEDKIKEVKSSFVTSDCLEEKISEMKSSFVTSDCLEEKLSEMKSSINKTIEDFKLYTNSGEVTTGEDDYDEGEEDKDYDDDYDDEDEDEDYEEEKDDLSAATPASDGTGENIGSENQECKDIKEDDKKKTNIVADGKSKTESDGEEVFDNEDNTPKEDLDTGLEEYDAYNDDIFFNDTDNKQKDIITQPQEQSDNKSAGNYNNRNDYNRDKEVVDLIQSLEQAKRRVDDLERIVSKYEKGYSLFKLQACFSPSFSWIRKFIGVKQPKEQQKQEGLNDDTIKIPCSFFLNLPFSRILPMISYHCLFYMKKGNNDKKEEEIININNDEMKGEKPIISENFNLFKEEPINNKEENKAEEKERSVLGLETSPEMFCVSLFRIIKTSIFFLDFGLKIYYPLGAPHESAKTIVKTFWDVFSKQLFTITPWCIFLGFNLGPQLLFFFSLSYSDLILYGNVWNEKRVLAENEATKKSKFKILFQEILDDFKIEIRVLEPSI